MAIDNSYLLNLLGGGSSGSSAALLATAAGARAGATGDASGSDSAASASSTIKAPRPPWRQTEPDDPAIVKTALQGRKLIDEGAVVIGDGSASDDYRKLFTLYKGLNTLEALASQYAAKGVTDAKQAEIRRVFAKGLKEVNAYADSLKLEGVRLTRGAAMTRDQGTVGSRRTDTVYQTPVLHQGASTDAVAAFDGDVRFSLQTRKLGVDVTVDFDLAEMGGQTRSMANVVSYLNDKLEAAGLRTRFATERISGEAKPITVGGKTVTLPDRADQWRLNLKGDIGEPVTLSSPARAEAVYVASMAGKPESKTVTAGKTTTTAATLNGQLMKFAAPQTVTADAPPDPVALPGQPNFVDGRAFAARLGPEVKAVRGAAAGPDGAVYLVADVEGQAAGQPIDGQRDVALLKYDSAGSLVYARTLGADKTASGYALAVGADGRIAIAGSVTGGLTPGSAGVDAAVSDSFVTVFNAAGEEAWTQRRAARAADEATAVAFGADGSVYVAGRAKSAMPGSDGALGGWDSYVQSFSGSGAARGTAQFGGAGDDRAAALAVDDEGLVVAGLENGEVVARRFAVESSGALSQTGVRNLGAIQGSVTGLAIDDGQIYLAGSTASATLNVGNVTRAFSGGDGDVFVARLASDLQADAGDALAYLGGAGRELSGGLAVRDGRVYVAGSSDGEIDGQAVVGLGDGARDGFVASLDLDAGAIGWMRRFTGTDARVAPTSIAVDAEGASALDRLGLPSGKIAFSDSKLLTAATSLRPGDMFYVRAREGGAKTSVTITAGDTLATLSKKISRAAGFDVTVETGRAGEFDVLRIKPKSERASIEILAGPPGKDALHGLGLQEGVVSQATTAAAPDGLKRVYGLGLASDLTLDDDAAAGQALKFVQMAISTVKNAYNYITNPDLFSGSGKARTAATGAPPAYLTAQISNYQAALARLGGGG